ncbi:Major facilitator superfamily domain-containing protein 3 [Takifugu flavidus]|uniref:Major facilitator superfamily domain-containing protein 3 n=1 Tax=Takifugu flavidus TaxID=433684 RepID=A0A5C6N4V8_9TELE|nr:Major facilitator superfamily domain-containing protein 3 [Takifugu flavidus]
MLMCTLVLVISRKPSCSANSSPGCEQGAVTMFPLFLLDHHMTARELGFWNGVIAMGFSIGGSSLGGLLLTRFSIGAIMRRVFVLRTISMVFQSSLLTVLEPSTLLKGLAVLSLSVQHFLGGLITTLTFTTMMHCSQRADEGIQVTGTPASFCCL